LVGVSISVPSQFVIPQGISAKGLNESSGVSAERRKSREIKRMRLSTESPYAIFAEVSEKVESKPTAQIVAIPFTISVLFVPSARFCPIFFVTLLLRC
jgi:hypothetical protein